MQSPAEIFDVVNDRDEVIGSATRREVHARGLKHRAVHVFVFNERGELFVQQRSVTKDTFPRCYDSSASGHLDSGEEYDACAIRELREELGLTLAPSLLRRHFKIEACQQTGWEFVWVYSVRGDFEPRINPAELESGQFMTVERVEALVRDHPQECAPSFCRIVHEFSRRRLFPAQC